MSSDRTETRRLGLALLGIADDAVIGSISSLVSDPNTSAKDLSELPFNLLVLAQKFEEEGYLKGIPDLMDHPIPTEVIEAAKQILENEIGPLSKHPHLVPAILLAGRRYSESGYSEGSPDPVAEVIQVSALPFLFGPQPPYLPVLKVAIKAKPDREIMSEMLKWHDILFISNALLKQVSQHVENSMDTTSKGIVASLGAQPTRRIFTEIKETIGRLEQLLSGSNSVETGVIKGSISNLPKERSEK